MTRWLPLSSAIETICNFATMAVVGSDLAAIVRAAVRNDKVRKLGLRESDFSPTPIEAIPVGAEIDVHCNRISVAGSFTPGIFSPASARYGWSNVAIAEDDFRQFLADFYGLLPPRLAAEPEPASHGAQEDLDCQQLTEAKRLEHDAATWYREWRCKQPGTSNKRQIRDAWAAEPISGRRPLTDTVLDRLIGPGNSAARGRPPKVK